MSALPEGTVTVLFSDVEGSTSLVSSLDTHWGEALSGQRRLLRAAFAAHGGTEMGTEGDSFFVVFGAAHDAVRAAVDAQRALQQHHWPLDARVRVRMGLHTGEPQRHEDGYIGLDVHRGARIASTAHGGQIVLSAATRQLIGDPPDVRMRDLGWHRLKDLAEPEHLFDLDIDGLLSEFPPVRSLGTQANLPQPTTELVGRGAEVQHVRELLSRDDVRLATLTGPGGTGKTRLALAAGSALADRVAGVFFVPLAAAVDGDAMWVGIAAALGAGGSTSEGPGQRVTEVLATRSVLLVLDNLEQVAGADAVVAHLLSDCPQVCVLATSRSPLHLASEHVVPVQPLQVPAPDAELAAAEQSDAVRLFCARAVMVRPTFALTAANVADVVAICRRLDGLPLALELTAARLRMLSPSALLARLDEMLHSATGGADRPERQRTLRATIAWSHALLDPADQVALHRMAAFRSGSDLAALEAVVGFDGFDAMDAATRLVDASLVRITERADGEMVLSMLQTVRGFAREQLQASPDADQVLDAHASWCAQRAALLQRQLFGPAPLAALDAIDAAMPDIRAALEHTIRPGNTERLTTATAIVELMNAYWYRHRFLDEGRYWHERLIEAVGDDDSVELAQSLHGAAVVMLAQHEFEPAERLLERALRIARQLGDRSLEARELNSLGVAAHNQGDLSTALSRIEASLAVADDAGDQRRITTALTNLTVFYTDAGDFTTALEAADRAMALERASGDLWGQALIELNRCIAQIRVHGAADALQRLTELAGWVDDVGDDDVVANVLELFAIVLAELGESGRALQLAGAADAFRETREVQAEDAERLEQALAAVVTKLGPQGAATQRDAGRILDHKAAFALAAAVTTGPRSS